MKYTNNKLCEIAELVTTVNYYFDRYINMRYLQKSNCPDMTFPVPEHVAKLVSFSEKYGSHSINFKAKLETLRWAEKVGAGSDGLLIALLDWSKITKEKHK
jgi:hypothetical protein